MELSVGKGCLPFPNTHLPPYPLFPLPHLMYSQAGTRIKNRQSKNQPTSTRHLSADMQPDTFKSGYPQSRLLRSCQGRLSRVPLNCTPVRSYKFAKPCIGLMPCPVLPSKRNRLNLKFNFINFRVSLSDFPPKRRWQPEQLLANPLRICLAVSNGHFDVTEVM